MDVVLQVLHCQPELERGLHAFACFSLAGDEVPEVFQMFSVSQDCHHVPVQGERGGGGGGRI